MKEKLISYILSSIILVSIIISNEAPAQVIGNPPPECDIDPGIVFGPPDPGVPGPFDVVIDQYGSSNQSVNLPDFDFPVEFLAEVAYPKQTECGPFPIVFMMHGNHATCYNIDFKTTFDWPCGENQFLLPNYQGYRYLAEILASHGIIAVSISANAINANGDTNIDARGRLFQRHIGKWLEFSTLPNFEFGNKFIGKVDLKRVGIMGHSRGGGGAARLVDQIESSGSIGTIGGVGSGADIDAVLLVGAVDGFTQEDVEVTDTALGVILPYCDGDQEEMPSVAYYDASRYALPGDSGEKYSFEIPGANHNYFNTFWDPNETMIAATDDWTKGGFTDAEFCMPDGNEFSGRLTSEEQQGTLIAIGSAFFRTHLRNEKAFRPFLTSEALPPPSAKTDQIFVAYHPKDQVEERLDLNRLTDKFDTVMNTLGGLVGASDLFRFEYCTAGEGQKACLSNPPEFGFSGGIAPHVYSRSPINQLRIAWTDGIRLAPFFLNEIPNSYRDVSRYRALQFRAFVDYSDLLNPINEDQDLRVVLIDGAGLSASAIVSNHSRNLFYPPAVEEYEDTISPVPRAIFNTVRVPLSAFDGIFLTDIREVALVFDQTETGAINIVDLAFADEAANMVPNVSCSVAQTMLMPGGDKLTKVGLSVLAEDDGTPPSVSVSVYSDEDDLDSGIKQSSPDAKDIAPNTLRLRGERDKNGDGRVYIIAVTAEDDENALGHGCCSVRVPASNKPADMASIDAQAAAALDLCTGFAAASEGLGNVPNGFFEVGDGPIIGQDQ